MQRRISFHSDLQNGSTIGASWSSRRMTIWCSSSWGARDFAETAWVRYIHEGSTKTRFEYCEDSENSLTYFRAIKRHHGGITIVPELMWHVLLPYDWKEFVFLRFCPFSIQSILENKLIAGGKQSKEGRQTIFKTPLNIFGENLNEKAGSGRRNQVQ